jgi:uncharacterized protein (TIGR02145 family)
MTIKSKIIDSLLLLMGMLLILSSCGKDDDDNINPTNGKTTAVFNPELTYGTMTDQDGNIYRTITIGTQTWMAENLRTTKYQNGDPIPNIIDQEAWLDLTTGAYCVYDNSQNISDIATYGRLYNWYAVEDNRNISPSGWHVPTDAEWEILISYLEENESNKLRETDSIHWIYPSPEHVATNETGFTALPGGHRVSVYGFKDIGVMGFWWSATESVYGSPYIRFMYANRSSVSRNYNAKFVGYSVRCVKDMTP